MIGVIDESVLEVGAATVVYSLAIVTIDNGSATALSAALGAAFPRKAPFHWERDHGAPTRRRMINEMCAAPLEIHVAAAIVRHDQQDLAREWLLGTWLLPSSARRGVGTLMIERRAALQDGRERRFVRNWYRDAGPRMPQTEHISKEERLGWVADAAAGLWSDYVVGRNADWLDLLFSARRVGLTFWSDGIP